jgi:hypothetical protein
MYWISICWLILNLVVSLPLFIFIQNCITGKALISVTLVDLIYCDCLTCLYLLSLIYSVAIIHCLIALEAGLTLNNVFAEVYAGLVESTVFCLGSLLIISSVLRLITIAKKSEAAGLQLLGPENIAIVKVRGMSIIFSALLELFGVAYFKSHSELFNLFHDKEINPMLYGSANQKYYKGLFLLMTLVAIVINVIIKLHTRRIIKQLEKTATVDLTKQPPTNDAIQNKGFTLSLGSVAGMSVILLCASLMSTVFSTFDRKRRLSLSGPVQLTLALVCAPCFVILRNKK